MAGVCGARISSLRVKQNTLPQVGLVCGPPLQALGQSGELEIGTLVRFLFLFFIFLFSHLLAFATYLKPPFLFN